MFVWFAAGSVALVWAVFQSPAIDYRMVVLGSVLGVLEAPLGPGPLHTLLAPCVALGAVMALTVGRRLLRRRLLGVPIGMFLHLVLDGAWTDTGVFWWPLGSGRLFEGSSAIVERGMWSALMEVAGIAVGVWCWRRFGLSDPARRSLFLRSGHLERSFVQGGRTPTRGRT